MCKVLEFSDGRFALSTLSSDIWSSSLKTWTTHIECHESMLAVGHNTLAT